MNDEGLSLDASRCALIIQDLQNDVMIDGGAFAETRGRRSTRRSRTSSRT